MPKDHANLQSPASLTVPLPVGVPHPMDKLMLPISPIPGRPTEQIFTFSPRAVQRSVSFTTPPKRNYSLGDECISTTPITPSSIKKLRQMPPPGGRMVSEASPMNPAMLPLSAKRHGQPPTHPPQRSQQPISSIAVSQSPPVPAPTDDALPGMLEQLGVGSSLAHTAQVMGTTALETAIHVTHALGHRAEHIVAQTTQRFPLYSSLDMKHMVQNKYDLLQELSRSVVVLGELEEKQKLFTDKIQLYEEKMVQMQSLESENQRLETQLQHVNATVYVLEKECASSNTLIDKLNEEIGVLKHSNQRMMHQQAEREVVHDSVFSKYNELLDLYTQETDQNLQELEALRLKCEQLEQGCQGLDALKGKNSQLEQENLALQVLRQRCDQLEADCQQLQTLKDKCSALESDNIELTSLKGRCEQAELDNEKLVAQCATSEDVIANLHLEKESLQTIADSYSAGLHEKERGYATMVNELQEKYYRIICEKDERAVMLESEVITLKNDCNILRHQVANFEGDLAQCRENEAEFERSKQQFMESQSHLEITVRDLQTLAEENKSNAAKLNQLLADKDKIVQQLQGEKEHVSDSNDINKLRVDAYEQEINLLKQENSALRSELVFNKSEFVVEKQKVTMNKYHLQNLAVSTQELHMHLNSLKQDVSNQLTDCRSALHLDSAAITAVYDQAKANIEQMARSHQSEVAQHQATIAIINTELAQKDELIADMTKKISDVQEEKRNLSILSANEYQSIHGNMNHLAAENARLTSSIAEHEHKYGALASILESKELEAVEIQSDTQKQLLHLTSTVDELNITVSSLKQEMNTKESKFISSLSYIEESHNIILAELRDELATIAKESEAIKAVAAEKDSEISKLQVLLDEVGSPLCCPPLLIHLLQKSSAMVELEQELHTAHLRFTAEHHVLAEDHSQSLHDYEEKASQLQKEYDVLYERHVSVKAEYKGYYDKYCQLQHSNNDLLDKYAVLQANYAALRQRHEDSQKECQLLVEKHDEAQAKFKEEQELSQEMEETYERKMEELEVLFHFR